MPVALHAVGPQAAGMCLERQSLPNVVNSCCLQWPGDWQGPPPHVPHTSRRHPLGPVAMACPPPPPHTAFIARCPFTGPPSGHPHVLWPWTTGGGGGLSYTGHGPRGVGCGGDVAGEHVVGRGGGSPPFGSSKARPRLPHTRTLTRRPTLRSAQALAGPCVRLQRRGCPCPATSPEAPGVAVYRRKGAVPRGGRAYRVAGTCAGDPRTA